MVSRESERILIFSDEVKLLQDLFSPNFSSSHSSLILDVLFDYPILNAGNKLGFVL